MCGLGRKLGVYTLYASGSTPLPHTKPIACREKGLVPLFSNIAQWVSYQCGRGSTFGLACISIIVWAITGPFFHFSDTWQLVINTGTTIVTFLMVFLIQNTQARDTASIKLQLGELILVSKLPDELVSLDRLSEEQIASLSAQLAERAIQAAKAPRV